MDLARDCLDNELRDRDGAIVGRVDGIVIALAGKAQPRVVAIELGAVTLARRLHPRVGDWVRRAARRWGKAKPDPYRLPWEALAKVGDDWRVDVRADQTPGRAWERWLAEHVVGRIPGA